MKIGITGATGHIGVTICRILLERNYEVVALVQKDRLGIENLPITFVDGNVLDRESLKAFMGQVDAVIHAAGVIELGYSFNQRMYDVNVIGTKNIIEIAKEQGIKKLVHFSSVHAFVQQPQHTPVDEKRPFVDAHSVFYDQTKRDGHLLALEAAKNGLDVVVVCPTSSVGPPDFKPSKVGRAIMDVYKGSIPAVVRGGFDFADVRDVATGAVLALEKGRSGETYILGGEYYSIKQFSDYVMEAKGTKKRLLELPLVVAKIGLPFVQTFSAITKRPPIYDKTYIDILLDGNEKTLSDKAKQELGYSVRPFGETITDTVAWFIDGGILKKK